MAQSSTLLTLNSINNFDKESKHVLKICEICDHLEERFISKVKYACVYLKNEAYVVDDQDQAFNIVNNQTYRVDFLCNKSVQKFAYSYSAIKNMVNYHMLALTKDGRVFGWGENAFEQITKNPKDQIFDPVRLDFYYGYFTLWRSWCAGKLLDISETVILNTFSGLWKSMGGVLVNRVAFTAIACGQAHCMAVTKDNNIVVWGNNKYGQIGNGKRGEIEMPFKILVKKEHIQDFPKASVGGKRCCLLLSATLTALFVTLIAIIAKAISLTVMMCAQSFMKLREAPTYFQEDRDVDVEAGVGEKGRPNTIRAIACGAFHNLVLFENGDVWGWGDNEFGQLGRVTTICHTEPRPIFSNAISIAAVNNHSLVLCKKQHGTFLYTMGDNTYGQLGQFEPIQCRVPLRIEKTYNFQNIKTVNGISLGVTSEGIVYAWGLYRFEEIKGRQTNVMTHSKKAYIIEEPKQVNCRSINEFISRYSSLTRETITIRETRPGDEHSFSGVLIEENELTVVEYIQQQDKNDNSNKDKQSGKDINLSELSENSGNKVIHVSTQNKYVLFDSCNVTANRDLSVKDITQSGFLNMFKKKK